MSLRQSRAAEAGFGVGRPFVATGGLCGVGAPRRPGRHGLAATAGVLRGAGRWVLATDWFWLRWRRPGYRCWLGRSVWAYGSGWAFRARWAWRSNGTCGSGHSGLALWPDWTRWANFAGRSWRPYNRGHIYIAAEESQILLGARNDIAALLGGEFERAIAERVDCGHLGLLCWVGQCRRCGGCSRAVVPHLTDAAPEIAPLDVGPAGDGSVRLSHRRHRVWWTRRLLSQRKSSRWSFPRNNDPRRSPDSW